VLYKDNPREKKVTSDTSFLRIPTHQLNRAYRRTVPSGPDIVPSHLKRFDSVSGKADYSQRDPLNQLTIPGVGVIYTSAYFDVK